MSTEIRITNKSPKVTEIDIEGIIGEASAAAAGVSTYRELDEAIKSIAGISARTIVVNIRSTGGNVNDAILIYEALKALKCRIITRCYGYVASAATIIAQAAARGKREISKNALYLIHRSASAAEGNAEEIAKVINLLDKTDERIAAIYAERSGRPAAEFEKLMAENNGNGMWLSPGEAVEKGLADRIIAAEEISNEAKADVGRLKLPEIPANDGGNIMRTDFKTHWKTLLEVLGIGARKDDGDEPAADEAIGEIGPEPDGHDTIYGDAAVTELRNRIVELEAMNAKLRTKATQTLPKEDPSMNDFKRQANAEAYEQDIANFKNY